MKASWVVIFGINFLIIFFFGAVGLRADSWTSVNPMAVVRYSHTATLLTDGRVLVAGGNFGFGYLTNAEIFDPASGGWTNTGSLKNPRGSHTATMLQDGNVLVVGGTFSTTAFLASAEIYQTTTGIWTNTGALHTGRQAHTATLLLNGQVLVAGGFDGTNYLNSAELFDPATGQWTLTTPMNQGRSLHTATLLSNGTVLVAGGYNGTNSLSSAEVFDPVSGAWTVINAMTLDRRFHTATRLPDGRVLVIGGRGSATPQHTAEVYDPISGNWAATVSTTNSWYNHTASLLPNGMVLISSRTGGGATLFDPVTLNWVAVGATMNAARQWHTATLLPSGRLLIAGGLTLQATNGAEIYDYAVGSWATTPLASTNIAIGVLTPLPDGKVLASGGSVTVGADSSLATNFTQLYDPATGIWTATTPMNYARANHTATLLPNGNVLVAGGYLYDSNGVVVSRPPFSEIYVPASGQWLVASNLNYPRDSHTATLLPNGLVLVAGGKPNATSAEVFDPTTGGWTSTGSLIYGRWNHTATLLSNGKVLVTGGNATGLATGTTETYNPATGTWTTNGLMTASRYLHSATLLPSGKVLVAGGVGMSSAYLSSAELFDPATGKWTNTGAMAYTHYSHKAVVLPTGKVLVAGSIYPPATPNMNALKTELYDPFTGTWSLGSPLNVVRYGKAQAFLPTGKFLVAGGTNLATAEQYDPGIGFTNTSQPQILSIPTSFNLGDNLIVTGAQFRGMAEASGNNNSQDSASDYPLVQLRSIENGQIVFEPAARWGTNSFISQLVLGFPPGPALATVFVNGIQSTSSIVNIGVVSPTFLSQVTTNHAFQLRFNYYPGASFSIYYSPNLADWYFLGPATENTPGQFQFTDTQAKNYSQRYYRITSP